MSTPLFQWNVYDEHYEDWDWFTEMVWGWLEEHNATNSGFIVKARNVGWRNLSGLLTLHVDNGRDFLNGIVGLNCDWSIQLFDEADNGYLLRAKVYHHDSPTGEERYIYTYRQWIGAVVANYTIQQLQKFLTGWREIESESSWWDLYYYDERVLEKLRRYYTKADFVTLLLEMRRDGYMTYEDLLHPECYIEYYQLVLERKE